MSPPHYPAPDWLTKHVFNPLVSGFTRMGLSAKGSRILEVKGRSTGAPRRTPVNLLNFDGNQYLVAPRGETQWVRNVRADQQHKVTLILGRRRQEHAATEIVDSEKVPVLRAYLEHWQSETGKFFGGVTAQASDEELAAIAPRHPVFLLSPAA
jgi:deazaflavin-dependent oxidoreductase (nitroreductase family)